MPMRIAIPGSKGESIGLSLIAEHIRLIPHRLGKSDMQA
jgi:hypothetical protein